MAKPFVLVPADLKEFENYRWHSVANQYLEAAIAGAGATPLILPAFGDQLDIDGALDRVDGVMLTGSRSNVYPEIYGVTPSTAHEPYDHARDATTLPLIRRAIERGIPLLAICRGFQELNVALGGTLATEIQDIDGRMDHRAPVHDDQKERFRIRHQVIIETGSCLGRIMDADKIDVNSLHRQGIARLAPGLTVEGVAPDGTIEAVRVEGAKAFAVGVQWHPEYWVKTDSVSARLFQAFGDELRERMGARLLAARAAG